MKITIQRIHVEVFDAVDSTQKKKEKRCKQTEIFFQHFCGFICSQIYRNIKYFMLYERNVSRVF